MPSVSGKNSLATHIVSVINSKYTTCHVATVTDKYINGIGIYNVYPILTNGFDDNLLYKLSIIEYIHTMLNL